MLIEVKVFGLAMDPITNTPIVILKDLEGKRPMTHDLMNEILKVLEVKVVKIVINDLKDNTFFAGIHIMKDGEPIAVDARPSDAIAIALRSGAPIFVDEKIIEKSTNIDFGRKAVDLNKYSREQLKEFLENLSSEDFGKYKM